MFCIVVLYHSDDGDPSEVYKVYSPYANEAEAHAAIVELQEDFNDPDYQADSLSWDVHPIEQVNVELEEKLRPAYRHDCERCVFLGTIASGRDSKVFDLYAHKRVTATHPLDAEMIARFGNDGPDYYSTSYDYIHLQGRKELMVAKVLWKAREESN